MQVQRDEYEIMLQMHMFYHRTLIAVGGFAATAQGATVAIGGGNIDDPGQISAMASGVIGVAAFAICFFALSLRHLRIFHRALIAEQKRTQRAWRPNSEILFPLAVGFLVLNAMVLVAAIYALVNPDFFAANNQSFSGTFVTTQVL